MENGNAIRFLSRTRNRKVIGWNFRRKPMNMSIEESGILLKNVEMVKASANTKMDHIMRGIGVGDKLLVQVEESILVEQFTRVNGKTRKPMVKER